MGIVAPSVQNGLYAVRVPFPTAARPRSPAAAVEPSPVPQAVSHLPPAARVPGRPAFHLHLPASGPQATHQSADTAIAAAGSRRRQGKEEGRALARPWEGDSFRHPDRVRSRYCVSILFLMIIHTITTLPVSNGTGPPRHSHGIRPVPRTMPYPPDTYGSRTGQRR